MGGQVIDVGQGLSVLVQRGGGLLYDTGDALQWRNLADAAILPLLREEGVRQLDYLIMYATAIGITPVTGRRSRMACLFASLSPQPR